MKKLLRFLYSRYTLATFVHLIPLVPFFMLCLLLDGRGTVAVLVCAMSSSATVAALYECDMPSLQKRLWLCFALLFPLPTFTAFLSSFTAHDPGNEHINDKHVKTEAIRKTYDGISTERMAEALLFGLDEIRVYSGTRGDYIGDGGEYFDMLLHDIENAKASIHLEYYIVADGTMLSRISELLIKKARTGCDVRLLYDGLGTLGGISSHMAKRLRSGGVVLRSYDSSLAAPVTWHNRRDHRKAAVIDGRIAYVGGINLSDEYANINCRLGHWKDCAVRLEGDCAHGIDREYERMWHKGDSPLTVKEVTCATVGDGALFAPFFSFPRRLGGGSVGKEVYMRLIDSSRSSFYITTPYLIIDGDIVRTLTAAVRRGVDVRIIIPHVKDKAAVGFVTNETARRLWAVGVKIHEYSPGFIHQKLTISDGRIAAIGTLNLDYRSFYHNCELGVIAFGGSVVDEARDDFLLAWELSARPQSVGKCGSYFNKLICGALRILSPLF